MLQYWYYGPWRWVTEDVLEYWAPPDGLIGLDLRTVEQMSQRGGSPGMGVFRGPLKPSVVGNDYTLIGSGGWHELKSTGRLRSMLRNKGGTPEGEDLVGVLFDLFTRLSDPDGVDGPKPLVPTSRGAIQLCAGQRYQQRFRYGHHPHTAKLQSLLQRDFKRVADDAKAGRMRTSRGVDHDQDRRVLDFLCDKYRLDKSDPNQWKLVVPQSLRKNHRGPLKHETTITESFNTADSDTLGPDLTWAEVNGDIDIVSNAAAATSNGSRARAESDLSGSDHYSQHSVVTSTGGNGQGACVRYGGASDTCYLYFNNTSATVSGRRIFKIVSGSLSQLLNAAGGHPSLPYTTKLEVDGSSLEGFADGASEIGPHTDSSISSGTRCGFYCDTSNSLDSFEAGDLSAGGGITYTQLERGVRGFERGVYTGGIQ